MGKSIQTQRFRELHLETNLFKYKNSYYSLNYTYCKLY